jgi:short-subunit dehydrogenase
VTETVVVTVAGSGIGREFVRLFIAEDSSVLAVSILQAELDQLQRDLPSADGHLPTLCMNLASADAAERLIAWCQDRCMTVVTLINNAGFACFGEAVTEVPARVASMIALNVTTVTKAAMLFGAQMKARGRGRILNVGSTAGMVPYPNMVAYCATKAYVNSFTFTLATELKPFGVTVACLAPGATQTRFAEAGGILNFSGASQLKALFVAGKACSPSDVARDGYRGLLAGRNFVLTGKLAGTANLVSRLLPQRKIPGLRRRMTLLMGPP